MPGCDRLPPLLFRIPEVLGLTVVVADTSIPPPSLSALPLRRAALLLLPALLFLSTLVCLPRLVCLPALLCLPAERFLDFWPPVTESRDRYCTILLLSLLSFAVSIICCPQVGSMANKEVEVQNVESFFRFWLTAKN